MSKHFQIKFKIIEDFFKTFDDQVFWYSKLVKNNTEATKVSTTTLADT